MGIANLYSIKLQGKVLLLLVPLSVEAFLAEVNSTIRTEGIDVYFVADLACFGELIGFLGRFFRGFSLLRKQIV